MNRGEIYLSCLLVLLLSVQIVVFFTLISALLAYLPAQTVWSGVILIIGAMGAISWYIAENYK